ncbi:hypothetical protein GH146_04710 [archaeon]|nr:hypothetical protein [archaeon]
MQSAFIGYEKMQYHSITLIIQSILKAGFMILLVILRLGVYRGNGRSYNGSVPLVCQIRVPLYVIVYKTWQITKTYVNAEN